MKLFSPCNRTCPNLFHQSSFVHRHLSPLSRNVALQATGGRQQLPPKSTDMSLSEQLQILLEQENLANLATPPTGRKASRLRKRAMPEDVEDPDDEFIVTVNPDFDGDDALVGFMGEDDDDDEDEDGDEEWGFIEGEDGSEGADEELFSLEGGWSVDAMAAGPSIDPKLAVQKGGSGKGASEPDELGKAAAALLASIPDHILRNLRGQELEAGKASLELDPNVQRKAASRRKTHKRLRIIAGSAAGRQLQSPAGDQTRPMMEKVRAAVFNMLLARAGGNGQIPEGMRWLDLFAGTGSVGIEALSRGCDECHFIEMDPWVVRACLGPNLEACDVVGRSVVHTTKAEDFLRRAADGRSSIGKKAFDFISVCPPYLLVSYEELYDLLEVSPLLHPGSIVVVEYPQSLKKLIRPRMGPLKRLRDRKYGRTLVAIYGPDDQKDDQEEVDVDSDDEDF